MLAPSLSFARFGLVIAATLVASTAIAQAPPDLPPLSGPPVQPEQPAPVDPPASSTPPAVPNQPWPGPHLGLRPQGAFAPYGGATYPYSWDYTQPPPPPPRQIDYHLPPPPPRRFNNPGMLAGGVVMIAAGLAGVITGAVLVSTAVNRIDIYCDSPSFPCAHMDDGTRKTGGALLMAGGAVVGALGIPLWIIGAKKVPIVKAPEVRVGAGTASVMFRF